MSNRTKRRIVKSTRILTIIFTLLTLISIVMGFANKVYAEDSWEELGQLVGETAIWTAINFAFAGIPALLMTAAKLVILIGGLLVQGLMSGVYSSLESKFDAVSLVDIIFAGAVNADGKHVTSEFLSVDFFDFSSGTIGAFRTQIAKWYYILRLISTAILLVILIYIGIRMALSTIAQEQAKYKQMLVDWITSLALLFLLHYIIMFAIRVNSALVQALYSIAESGNIDTSLFSAFFNGFNSFIMLIGFEGIFAAVLYAMFVGQTAMFFLLYMKRMITVGFLIMIAPLITITYSIDKIGDGKSQALNSWLKELVYNILIQPFHCITYLAFFSAINTMIKGNTVGIGAYVFAIMVMKFMKKAEDILRKIFHFEASSMSSISESGQNLMNATGKFTKMGAAAGKGFASFKAAGGWSAARKFSKENREKFKLNRASNKELKETFESKQKSGEIEKDITFKQYKKSQEGQSELANIKQKKAADFAAEAQAKREKKDKTLRDKAKAKYDEKHGEGEFEKLEATAQEKDSNGQPTEEAKKAAEKIKNLKDDARSKPKKVISGISNGFTKASDGFTKWTQSDQGKLVMAGLKDSTKVASAIAMGSMALGATGEINDAISMGQLGYGFSSGLLENSKNSLGNDASVLMEKFMEMTGMSSEEINKKLNEIKINGGNGDYDKIGEILDGYLSKFKAILGDKALAKQIAQEIKLSIADSTRDFDLDEILSKYNVKDEDKNELKEKCSEFSEKFAESQLWKSIQKAESIGTDVDTFSSVIEKKVVRHEQYVKRTKLNVEVRQGANGIDVNATDEDGNSTRETAPTGNGPTGNGPTGNP